MTHGENIALIGQEFGKKLSQTVNNLKTISVAIGSVDTGKGVANVFIFEEDKTFPVPLQRLDVPTAVLTVVPTVGSGASIVFLDGNPNLPVFTSFESIDSFEFSRSKTSVRITVDPEDDTKDAVDVVVGESSVHIDTDVIQFNGGELNGLVVVGKLTERLNKMQSEIDKIQSAISNHTHTVTGTCPPGTAGGPLAAGRSASTTYSKVSLTSVEDKDYENEKITQ